VAGGLLNGGADGAWLRTPPDWALLFGRLILDAASATTTTFDLVSVCLAGTPNPSTPTSAPPPRTGHASPELPATGNNAGPIAAAGVVLVFVGVAMVWLYRRRLAE
jgi:LPXTG-motif cell wall-anchored protein